ncbi:MAG: hypothetical protein HRU41_23715 [Saprospiraceae bacterium]|nr:hypothetical protein [Saprospiraceae bacterium]
MRKPKVEDILYPISGTTLCAITFTAILQEVFGLEGQILFESILLFSLVCLIIMIYMNLREAE